MVRLRGPFRRPDAAVADDGRTRADQSKKNAEESDGDSPSEKRLRMTEDENSAENSSAHLPINDTIPEDKHASLWNDNHRRLYQHLQARRAGTLTSTSTVNIDNIGEEAISTNDAVQGGSPGHNIYETLLGRIHKSLEQLHDQNHERNNGQSSAEVDSPIANSGTSPTSTPSTPPKHSPDPSAVPLPSNKLRSKKRKRITKRRYPSPVPVKGTKADRLRECLKYFPKRPSPCSFSHPSSSQDSSPSFESRSVTPEVSPEAEED